MTTKIIEFIGMPRAGKTTQLTLLAQHLRAEGYSVATITDRGREELAVPPAESLAYVITLASLALQRKFQYAHHDFLLVDRGLNDVIAWADCYLALQKITAREQAALKAVFERFAREVSLTLNLQISVPEALVRHRNVLSEHNAADDQALNEPFLTVLQQSYKQNETNFHSSIYVDGHQPIEDTQRSIRYAVERITLGELARQAVA